VPHIPVGFGQAVFTFKVAGDNEEMLTTLGFATDADTSAERTGVADLFFDAWRDNLTGMHVSTCDLNRVDVYFGTTGGTIPSTSTLPPNGGTGGTGMLPPNTSILIRKLTNQAGRKNRGRMYVPGTPESIVDNVGLLGATNETSYNNQLELFRTQVLLAGNVTGLRILHSDPLDAPTEITGFKVDPKVATQRRRLR